MKTIVKYPFSIDDRFQINMPQGAQILLVELQGEQPTMWALVDTDVGPEPRRFAIFGTGHPVGEGVQHVGSFQMRPYVWHLFEELR